MPNFTVEVTTRPVADGDFAQYYRVIDAVPGTVLLEDPDEPVLMVPVDADNPLKAGQFVDGLTKLVNIEVIEGRIYPTPEVDFDLGYAEDEQEPVTKVVTALSDWVDRQPEFDSKLNRNGELIPS